MDTDHPAIASVLRAKDREADPDYQRAAVRHELEAEARGLLMAARMHGFQVTLMHGTSTVIDTRAVA